MGLSRRITRPDGSIQTVADNGLPEGYDPNSDPTPPTGSSVRRVLPDDRVTTMAASQKSNLPLYQAPEPEKPKSFMDRLAAGAAQVASFFKPGLDQLNPPHGAAMQRFHALREEIAKQREAIAACMGTRSGCQAVIDDAARSEARITELLKQRIAARTAETVHGIPDNGKDLRDRELTKLQAEQPAKSERAIQAQSDDAEVQRKMQEPSARLAQLEDEAKRLIPQIVRDELKTLEPELRSSFMRFLHSYQRMFALLHVEASFGQANSGAGLERQALVPVATLPEFSGIAIPRDFANTCRSEAAAILESLKP